MKRLILLLVLLWHVAGAAQPPSGIEVTDRGGYDATFLTWRRLAERGDAGAQFNLALMYARGEGAPQDHSAAVTWYRLAAEQDHAKAQLNLGYMYNGGHGVPQDHVAAVRWFRLAAEQGHAIAQANVGRQYYYGEGVPEDYVRSYAWFALAAAQGDSDSFRNKNIMIKVMTLAQIAEAQKLSETLCAKIPDCTR